MISTFQEKILNFFKVIHSSKLIKKGVNFFMLKKYNTDDYLEFEKMNYDFMDAASVFCNRNKYNLSKADLINFYKKDYENYRVYCNQKGQPYKVRCKESNIDVKPKIPKKITIKTERKIVKFTDLEISTQLELFNKTFQLDDNVFVRLLCKKTGEYYSYPIAALKDFNKLKEILNSNRFSTKEDLMYTFNTYNTLKSATSKDLHLLTGIAIDIDFGEVNRLKSKKPLDIISILEKLEFNKTIPTPQIVEYGHNLRLIYVLDKVPATEASKTLASRLATTIGERLADYGGSKQPLTTYGRVIGSINSKSKDVIKVMYLNKEKYRLKDLQEQWLNPLPEWYPEWKAKTNRKVISFTKDFQIQAKLKGYNENRITDFYKIQDFYKEDDCLGFRRFLCFQVRNHAILSGMSKEESEKLMKDFNNKFRKPVMWREIERDTRNVERKQYKYRSETILNYISITTEEEILLQLEAILSKKEIARRNNNYNKAKQKAKYRDSTGLTKTEVKRLNEFVAIARLEIQGLSYREIAKDLGYSDHKAITRKINKIYENSNYKDILEEVTQGIYDVERIVG